MLTTMLCTALATWTLGGALPEGRVSPSPLAVVAAPAHIWNAADLSARSWVGAWWSERPFASTELAIKPESARKSAVGASFCTVGGFGADGRPVSQAWGSRAFGRAPVCGVSGRLP